MTRFWLVFSLAFLGAIGCAAEIGDDCNTNLDCGTAKQCDLSQPGGYCTAANCDSVPCPDGAICVAFSEQDHFCMAACDSNSDCRDSYVCVKNFGPHPFCNSVAAPE
ncbi:MAG: hypothetical protein HUU55_23975 [Myxococcales bacterium]|nr:hypothetical protein [Myxococcales bacterium]